MEIPVASIGIQSLEETNERTPQTKTFQTGVPTAVIVRDVDDWLFAPHVLPRPSGVIRENEEAGTLDLSRDDMHCASIVIGTARAEEPVGRPDGHVIPPAHMDADGVRRGDPRRQVRVRARKRCSGSELGSECDCDIFEIARGLPVAVQVDVVSCLKKILA